MAHKSPMLHSIYDLTTYCRSTTGDVPPKLVGASTTVVGSKMYLFGGRLVTERRMVSDLFVFDMETLVWERIPTSPEDVIPRARYFHSADAWNNHLVVFGGMSNQPESSNPDELCVLNDVHFFSLSTGHWLPPHPAPSDTDPLVPRARYAHLSSVTGDKLFIIGGQDFYNTWLDDICIFHLGTQAWVQRRDYPRHCGTYRSVAVSSPTVVRSPQDEPQTLRGAASLGPVGSRFADKAPASSLRHQPPPEATPSSKLMHLPYTSAPTEEHPSDVYLYSNYNFTDVKRELEVFSPLPSADFTIQDRSPFMTGSTFPPGLRFPTGALLGTHLIIAGTYLAHSYQSFSIWVLDLTSMTWSRIDPGKAIESGSWFRGCLWAQANKFIIFGNKHGNLVDDYNRRLLSWDHVAIVDLEAFGIYEPPPLKFDLRAQELGLAALEEGVLADFEVVCEDGQRIACSRRLLEDRWGWFRDERRAFVERAAKTLEGLPTSPMHVPLPVDVLHSGKAAAGPNGVSGNHAHTSEVIDPRLTPRRFYLSEPYPIVLAFLQYLYSQALLTPLQHTPGVLGQLLILATTYGMGHLEGLVKHAMHRSLTNPNSVGVYEVTTLCSCRSLQIRALKTVMSYTQKRPSRRAEREGGGAGGSTSSNNVRSPDNNGDGGYSSGVGGSGGAMGGPSAAGAAVGASAGAGMSPSSKYVSRPRGTSDAKWRTMTDNGAAASSSGYNSRSALISPASISTSSTSASGSGSSSSPTASASTPSTSTSIEPFMGSAAAASAISDAYAQAHAEILGIVLPNGFNAGPVVGASASVSGRSTPLPHRRRSAPRMPPPAAALPLPPTTRHAAPALPSRPGSASGRGAMPASSFPPPAASLPPPPLPPLRIRTTSTPGMNGAARPNGAGTSPNSGTASTPAASFPVPPPLPNGFVRLRQNSSPGASPNSGILSGSAASMAAAFPLPPALPNGQPLSRLRQHSNQNINARTTPGAAMANGTPRPTPMIARLPRRPTTADAALGPAPRRPAMVPMSSSEDVRGAAGFATAATSPSKGPKKLTRARPSTGNASTAPSKNVQMSFGQTMYQRGFQQQQQQQQYPVKMVQGAWASSQGMSTESLSLSTPGSDSTMASTFRSSEFTAIGSDTGGGVGNASTEDLYIVPSMDQKPPPQWPRQVSQVRWITPGQQQQQPPPLQASVALSNEEGSSPTSTVTPGANNNNHNASVSSFATGPLPPTASTIIPRLSPPAAGGNAFTRFLSRNKEKQREKEKDHPHAHPAHPAQHPLFRTPSGNTAPDSPTSLDNGIQEVKAHLAELDREEEKRRLKKEAKIRDLLSRQAVPVAMSMSMLG